MCELRLLGGELSDTIFLPAYAPPTSWAKEAKPAYAEAEYAQAEEQPTGEEPLYGTAEASEYGGEQPAESAGESGNVEVPLEQLEGQEEELPIEEEALAGEGAGWGEEYGTGASGEEGLGSYQGEPPEEGVAEAGVGEEEYPEDFEGSEEPQGSEYEIAPMLTVIPEPGDTVSGIVDMVVSYSGPPAKFVIFTFDAKGEVMMNTPPYSSRWDTSKLEPGTHQVRIQVLGEDEGVLVDQTSAYTVVAPAPKKPPEAGGS